MVQGGFNGGFKRFLYVDSNNKTEANFGPGINLEGIRTGFKEETFLPMVGGDPMSRNHGGAVKTKVGEAATEEHPLRDKRIKNDQRHKRIKNDQMGSPVTSTTFSEGLSLHSLEEPSPLGLTLKKTPSFIELIQMTLSQGDSAVPPVVKNSSLEVGRKNDSKCAARRVVADKHKASNFPALVLRIGSWECISRYEGDLVAKCYFAKRKLVWEVLESGLKSKMEIQWSDITSLNASFPDNERATLEIEVSRPPLFFRETDPQPRKHTVWHVTNDFTGGQASTRRRHLLQFAEGILERHYEKLLRCDDRLNLLSKKGIMGGDSSYFDSSTRAIFQDQNEQNCHGAADKRKSDLFPQLDHLKVRYLPPFSSFSGTGIPRVSQLVPEIEPLELDGRVLYATPQDTPSPCSVMDSRATEESGISDADDLHVNMNATHDQMIFAELNGRFGNQSSDLLSVKSMDNLFNHTVSRLSEKKFSHNSVPTAEESWQENERTLDDIAHHFLIDSPSSAACDEQKVIARDKTLYSVIENDVSAAHSSSGNTKSLENSRVGYGLGRLAKGEDDGQVCERNDGMMEAVLNRDDKINSQVNEMEDGYIHGKQSTGIPRQDSVSDLLVNIPRISSFPCLFDDSSDEFITSADQPETAGWNFFQ